MAKKQNKEQNILGSINIDVPIIKGVETSENLETKPNKVKVDSCLIVKNEVENLKKLIPQLLEFSHEIHITDTGSDDGTVELLQEYQEKYSNFFYNTFTWDFNFSHAKNFNLDYENCTADYQFWCDADDLLNDTLIETIQKFINETNVDQMADIYYLKYKYHANDKDPHIRTSFLKVSANLRWVDAIHEFIPLREGLKLNTEYFNNGSLLLHQRVHGHSTRNLDIFRNMELKREKFSGRNYYYYATELINNGFYECGKQIYLKCIYNTESFDPQDKINSCINLFNLQGGKENDWIDHANFILKQNVCRGDLLYFIGQWYFLRKMYNVAYSYFLSALSYPNTINESFMLHQINVTVNPLLQLGYIEYIRGNINKTYEYNKKVLEYDPNNEIAKKNIMTIENSKSKQDEQK